MRDYESIKDRVLYFDGCSLPELAAEYGTPLYVYSENKILDKIKALKKDFLDIYPKSRAAYACKALCIKEILRLIEMEGLSIDIVSGGELYTAMSVNFPPERIEFNGNNKLPSELEMAVSYGIGRIIIDGPAEALLLEEICDKQNKDMKVLIRITPGVKSSSHDYIVTGKKDSKFGLPPDDYIILPCIEEILKSKHLKLLGFHFHVGSQLLENESYIKALDVILGIAEKCRLCFGYIPKELNLGGGFAVRYTDEKPGGYAYYLNSLLKKIQDYYSLLSEPLPTVVIEPGRSIVAEAGLQLYTAGQIKTIPGIRKYVSVDGGMTDNIRPALYQAKYSAAVANKADRKPEELVTLCGKCCESGDILIKDIKLPKIEIGDIIAVRSTGAYGYSMASNYNKNPIPAVIFVKDGKSRLVVKRQNYEDIIAREI